jgi:hypothetical protein
MQPAGWDEVTETVPSLSVSGFVRIEDPDSSQTTVTRPPVV